MNSVVLTVDLGFGDAGKGSLVDFLVREHDAHTVVRYNGGAQAGHRVVTADGREHVFSQFGAGTLAGADTYLSRFMMIEPFALEAEAEHLVELGIDSPFAKLTIDENALVTTPFHRAINRLKELSRSQRHGSCGIGVGETMVDFVAHDKRVLLAGDLRNEVVLHNKLTFLRGIALGKLSALNVGAHRDASEVAEELDILEDEGWVDWIVAEFGRIQSNLNITSSSHLQTILNQPGTVVFEGAQGVLLDEWYGFHPHTTWSTITLANADTLLDEADYRGTVTRIGLTRAYSTRHGAGPFVSEDVDLTRLLPDAVNGFDAWQEGFRVGWLDLVMLRYALEVVGKLDYLAVTCLDRLIGFSELKVCHRYLLDDGREDAMTRLVVKDELEDLEHQAQLTELLGQVMPDYRPIANIDDLLGAISAETNLPIGILSYGATAQDKRLLLNQTVTALSQAMLL